VAANLPDADLILGFLGSDAYLLWHRGLTHSFLGLAIFPPALALLASGAVAGLGFGRALVLAEVGALSHLALDLPTAWGTIALYPWNNARLALDWVFIVDPVLWAIFAFGLAAGWRWWHRRVRAAVASLVAAAIYIGASGALHGWATAAVRERLEARIAATPPAPAAGEAEQRTTAALGDVEVLPLPFYGPLRWHAVAWAGDELLYARVNGVPPVVRPTERERHGLGDPRVHGALMTPAGQAFLWWARVPAGRVLRESEAAGSSRRPAAGAGPPAAGPGDANGPAAFADAVTVVGLADRRFWIRGDVFGLEIALDREGRYLGAAWEGDSVFVEGAGRLRAAP
jgi:inner membrane protein